jgi:flagellar basal-body rod protein FlgB
MPTKLFDRTLDLLQRSLDLRTTQHQVLSHNIANSATPQYTPKEVPFQKILEQSFGQSPMVQLVRTHPGHLPEADLSGVEIENADHEVSLDEEMAKLAENNLRFQAGVQALVKKFEAMRITLIEGGK